MEEDYEASLSSPENENELLDIQGQSVWEQEQSGKESDDNQKPPTKPNWVSDSILCLSRKARSERLYIIFSKIFENTGNIEIGR